MGFCYQVDWRTGRQRLCCDSCGVADGSVRRRRCPSDWCQASAMCAGCWADPPKRGAFRAYHVSNDCAGKTAYAEELSARRAALLASGAFVRDAALNEGGAVRVWFRDAGRREVSALVSREVYRAVPLGVPATPSDFGVSLLPGSEVL